MRYAPNDLENHWMPFTSNRDFKNNPRLYTKAKGMYYETHDGRKLADGSSGLFCVPLGHGREEIARAVYEQLQTCDFSPHFQVGNPNSFMVASKLTRILPKGMSYTFFTGSGSESIDTAIKIAMAYHRAKGQGQRTRFVSRERAYHGVNIGGVSLSGMVKNRETFTNTMSNVVHMRHTWMPKENGYTWGEGAHGVELAEDLQRAVDTFGGTTIAACFVEPVAGSTGVLVPPKGYLKRLREICDKNGILLVFDEVITGFGRLGTAFASEAFDVIPDIMTMAKGITNGAQPMGAVSVKDEIYHTINSASPEDMVEFFHGYTYSGHPCAAAASVAVLDIYEREDTFAKSTKLHDYFRKKMMSLKGMDNVTDIRGYGLMCGIDTKLSQLQGTKVTYANDIHVKFTGPCAIVAVPLVADEGFIDEVTDKLRLSLK